MSASPKDGAAAAAHGPRFPWETDEEYLARVTPYLDNEGRARVQEALSERLAKGGIAVPPGGDS